MSIIDWILLALIFFLILTLIAFGMYYAMVPSEYIYLNPITGQLNSQTSFNDSTITNFVKGSEGTLSVFLYLNPTQRTATYQNIQNSITTTPLDTANNFTIFSIGTYLIFKQYPSGASGNDAAQLQIITIPSGGNKDTESFTFPPIPKQEWICVTLTRVGRRFTVYYNNKMVSSFRTVHYPIIDSVNTWNIGVSPGNNSSGLYAYPYGAQYALTETEIQKQIRSVADSRNKPILPKPMIMNVFSAFGGCPNGIFCYSDPTSSNPINTWTSPFA